MSVQAKLSDTTVKLTESGGFEFCPANLTLMLSYLSCIYSTFFLRYNLAGNSGGVKAKTLLCLKPFTFLVMIKSARIRSASTACKASS